MTLEQMIERKNAIYATEIDKAQTREELTALDLELRKLDLMIAEEQRKAQPAPAVERTAVVNGEIPGIVVAAAKAQEARKDKDVDSIEYRTAFMNYVTRGISIPVELRTDASTTTSDVASVIPTVLVDRIVEKLETFGNILPLVNKTQYAAGVKIPTSTVKPTATWVNEGAGSVTQEKTTSYISFTYHKLRCEVSMSMEVGTMALSSFENAFVKQVTDAMVKAIEAKIVSTNDGTTGPKGILAETPAAGQALTADELDYELLCDIEAAIPQAYENGAVHCMTKKTFYTYVGMTDANGQPIARVTYGVTGAPERTLLGRPVVLTDNLDSFSSVLTAGKIFHFVFNFADYTLNTIYDMGIQRKQDWDTEDYLTKAVMSVDGEVVDKNSLVTIAKAS
jgi:HK97 family phage major capsid protein